MGGLLERIKILKDEEGDQLSVNSTNWLLDSLKKPNAKFNAVRVKNMYVGKFYFMFYDMAGKSSKMEQYSPILLVDYRTANNKQLLYGISLNFIPQNVRLLFFDGFLDSFRNVFSSLDSKDKKGSKEQPLPINFKIAFDVLDKIGFQYIIREFDASLINKSYEVSMEMLPRFMTFNSAVLTGVDEKKLADIWESKLRTRQESIQKRVSDIISSYEEISKTFKTEFKNYEKEFESIQKSKENLKSLGIK